MKILKQFFKDATTVVQDTINPPLTGNALVQEIHNAFDNAEDELLCEAEKVLKELNIQTTSGLLEKAQLLKEVGFVKNPAVGKADAIIREEIMNSRVANMVKYYKAAYPFQKFLSEEQLESICKKYNLIFAPIKNYIGEVPEKNLLEIKNAQALSQKDVAGDKLFIRVQKSNVSEDCPPELRDMLIEGFFVEQSLVGLFADLGLFISIGFGIKEEDTRRFTRYQSMDYVRKTINRSGLFIAAPKNHFDLSELSKENEFGYFDVKEVQIDDPIVFRFVKGGVQVLSKWGLEASDPLLINPIEN